MTNSRQVGDVFEHHCIKLLGMGGTYGSGACVDDADLKDDHMLIECKVKNTSSGVNVPPALIEKVSAQAEKWRRDWAIACRTQAGDFVTMPLDVFAEIYEGYKDATSKEED